MKKVLVLQIKYMCAMDGYIASSSQLFDVYSFVRIYQEVLKAP